MRRVVLEARVRFGLGGHRPPTIADACPARRGRAADLVAIGLLASLPTLTSCQLDDTGAGETRPSAPGDSASAEPPQLAVPDRPDPSALDELLREAPTEQPKPTGPDGGTLVGSDTGLDGDAGAAAPIPPAPTATARASLEAGKLEIQPGLSNPAIERAAREQIYWPLVQKCRAPDGALLPPDAITLMFTIRVDGSVDPASVGATASEKRFEPAAECVVREFSALPFRGPPASIGVTSRVIATLPSVD